jgi:hypothetical protein
MTDTSYEFRVPGSEFRVKKWVRGKRLGVTGDGLSVMDDGY